MRGRKPTPIHLRLLNGNPSGRPIPREDLPPGDLHTPPVWMSEEQRAEWVYAVENAPRGLLRRLDKNIFAQWCKASVDCVRHELALRDEGDMIEKGGGQRITVNKDGSQTKTVRSVVKIANPRLRMMRDAFDRLMKATADLGFSPTSRARISLAGGGKTETNRFATNAAKRRA